MPVFKFQNLPYQEFPERKPADYKACRVLLKSNDVCYGFRYDTGFEREWEIKNGNQNIAFDDEVKGWWYIE